MIKPTAIPEKSPLVSKFLILATLLRKEFSIQSNKSELGFLWVFIEPLSQVLMFGFLIGVILKAKTVPDIPYPFFLVIGFQLIGVFKDAINSGMGSIGSHRKYLAYQKIGTLDFFIAKTTYNLLTNMFATVFFIMAGIWWGIDISLGNLHTFLGAYMSIWLLGCGCGFSLAYVTKKSLVLKRCVGMSMRPLIFVSCVLHPYVELSPVVAKYIYWNPLVHCVEMARKSIFPHYHIGDLNLQYSWIIVIIMLSLGISVFYKNRHYI